jgi:hypothetical protein
MAMTVRLHVKRTAVSTMGYGVTPAGVGRLLAPRLQLRALTFSIQPSKEHL